MKLTYWVGAAAITAAPLAVNAEPVSLYAAGSLRAALGEVAENFSNTFDVEVSTTFGPSGLMRERIEAGETAHVFASANMTHPQRLEKAERGGPVALFARNRLCALAQPELEVTSATLLETLLADENRLGTSTPGADPSGDYAWELFDRAEKLHPGAAETLKAKANQLTGGPSSSKPPEDRNTYGWVMEKDQADLFLTYCTNAVLAQSEVPDLQIVTVPSELAVGADYGLIVLNDAPSDAWKLALHILSPEGQAVLARYGFEVSALPVSE
ncbi:molybdate ABC transporter substrate-binding protein [Halovibrio sp. HP20-50]|uniref:molybdate ABC transporter substrate-binding protein n=1 Tax=Halovibrio sp. HP20-59 TaxID=3080275 RepID=UPI00294AF801|nr:molybdate ABC transporter substrate-binding protein [Halovibrio sp. HP20-59]MEA2117260.1 molybdate ABC transporter substrate-binding protein [Halovibrio sp. HP20-59]